MPDNYNPETREYTGVWTGGFKWAWTDNPAWIYYDIVIADRFGLGNRLSSANIFEMDAVPDCTVLRFSWFLTGAVVTAWSRAIPVTSTSRNATMLTPRRETLPPFSGALTCWNGEQIVVQADMPRDVDFTYTRANIIGKPRYSSSSSQVRYTNALVSWSDSG
ncbi:hypothetical protein [Klebsiella pneumoniae]|uniref:hypothetical protein n=1 Tax=Klebsiella pneumoniae TaxID=573 RepID=UPI003AF378CD